MDIRLNLTAKQVPMFTYLSPSADPVMHMAKLQRHGTAISTAQMVTTAAKLPGPQSTACRPANPPYPTPVGPYSAATPSKRRVRQHSKPIPAPVKFDRGGDLRIETCVVVSRAKRNRGLHKILIGRSYVQLACKKRNAFTAPRFVLLT